MKDTTPLMLTPIAAGFPSPADDSVDTNLNLHTLMVTKPEATFFMRVEGDSMQNVGISSGDIAVIDKSLTPINGQIVVAFLDGEFTLKRFKRDGDAAWLLPENENYQPIKVGGDNTFEVWGVVTYIVKNMTHA